MSEKIVELAREAGLRVGTNLSGIVLVGAPAEIGLAHLTVEELERFYDLAVADFKNRLAQAIEQMPFGDTATSFATFVRNFE